MRRSQNAAAPNESDGSLTTTLDTQPTTRPPSLPYRSSSGTSTQQAMPPLRHDVATTPSINLRRQASRPSAESEETPPEEPSTPASPNSALEKLRDAVGTLQRQNLGRFSQLPLPASPAKSNLRRTTMAASVEQQATSPSLDAAFATPLPTGAQTASTDSTESNESVKTIRGTALPTPNQYPLRTPSYPFPYVPATRPSALSFQLHQPFTTLSPTVSSSDVPTRANLQNMHDRFSSVSSSQTTTAATPTFFGPQSSNMAAGGASVGTAVPNLYDLVLQLNSDPALDTWWTTLTNILHDHYKVERASLALPADTTDIENVPWGQKAAYNSSGIKSECSADQSTNRSVSATSETSMESLSRLSDISDSPYLSAPAAASSRPSIESRHSYAGYEHGRAIGDSDDTRIPSPVVRPSITRRTTTHVSSLRRNSVTDRHRSPECPTPIHEHPDEAVAFGFGDHVPEPSEAPCVVILPTLRALSREQDALLDSSGVNRVLERGRLVVLTRDFSNDLDRTTVANSVSGEQTPQARSQDLNIADVGYLGSAKQMNSKARPFGRGAASTLGREDFLGSDKVLHYEDHEQFPTSPWAQSPAPSPAIQQDPEANPFFASGNLDEETFSPTPNLREDYSQFGQVEAIGIDNASTIIHIPLIHPLWSRSMSMERENHPPQQASEPDSTVLERKAPIAILSILSPDVPYPQTWIQSLKQLSPHLATSFHTGYQSTTMQERVAGALSRQQQSSRIKDINSAQLSGLGVNFGLESLLYFEPDDTRSSTMGSVTSPSEYSGRSRHSPTGSVVATPGVESHPHAATSRRPGTPNQNLGVDVPDDYFDVKKRISLHRARSGGPVSMNQISAQSTSRASSSDHRSLLRRIDTSPPRDNAGTPARREPRKTKARDERSSPAEASPGRKRGLRSGVAGEVDESRHSVLHSHGADFSASFQSLPVAAVPRPTGGVHTRSTSITDVFDMPPPSERLLRTIIDSLPVQIFTAAPLSGRVTWVNSKFLVYRGQTPRQVIEDPWETIHIEDLEEYKSEWQKSLQTGWQFQHKVRLRRFDDNYRWFYARAAPLRDKAQNIVHWVGTMVDLHDQYLAEMSAAKQQETAASESKYRALANSSPQIVFAATQGRGVTFCNTQWLVYSGQTEEQAKGTGFMQHVFPDDLVKCKLPVFDSSGTSAANVPLTVPHLPRRTKSGSSSTTADSEGSSDSNMTMTGVTTAADGQQMGQRKLSELATSGIARISRDVSGKPSYSTEVRLRMKSGEYRWHLVRVLLAEPLLQAGAEEETWYGTCTDINDHKELEQTLKETMDAKSRFLSNMSHEIRTPLNGISGMANFLIDSNLTAEQMDHVNIIRASTEGLRDLINDILDLSKVEAGMITLNMDWLHIRSVIEEVNDLTSTLALDKGIELNYMVEDDVPSMVKGDKFRFRQVLLNVIGNAIKFTQKGEVFVQCKISLDETLKKSNDSVLLQMDVMDTGAGFTEKEAERLFKRFSQIDGSSTRQHGGTGLGLVISMQLVELHGGHMTAKGVPGKGATFTFSIRFGLPTGDERPPEPPADSEPPVAEPSTLKHPEPPMQTVSTDPTFYAGLDQSPNRQSLVASPDSSNPSLRTARTSGRSSRSSQSPYTPEGPGAPIQLESVPDARYQGKPRTLIGPTSPTLMQARAYSILIICPLKWTLKATIGHMNVVLDHTIPHLISGSESVENARKKLEGPDAFTFSHVVLILHDPEASLTIVELILKSHPSTALVIVANPTQRRDIISKRPQMDFDRLASDRRLQFIGKPVKPSRLAVIFDPEKSRELSTDQNQHSAQKIALSQKRVFDEMTRRLGNKDIKVLLVEDNRINQMVMLKLLRRVSVEVETCLDGVQATDKVLSKPAEYFSIILLDLMMPNKDGYQTCRDIRQWEKDNNYPNIPIVALSANVLDDVWQKCKEAGFNSYLTKPVEFKELSDVMTAFLDPVDPSQPMDFMSRRPGAGLALKRSAGGGA